ncbi:Smr/MutS family protein [Pararhizobium sp.]|uniref:Smr/MutS family protein n=1 Tax=Pararhizobium sp. TaxID=1977563 RepID=UPI0027263EC8|nr:Smr/MutS family protein [Pararhizobium sp.]MDO9416807.1 Smr/MutS family protein [Pararhizobium sp.]
MAERKDLSSEDRILWGKVARTTNALPGRMKHWLELEDDLVPLDKAEQKPLKSQPVRDEPVKKSLGQPKQQQHVHHPLEKTVKRKLSKGRLALEARIDLHGLAQSEAKDLLLGFILGAHARGLRHVLVITGKGLSKGGDGVLKRVVPMWLSQAEFRAYISSHEPAARNHGGDGALYVRLSKSRDRGLGE